MLSKAAKPQNKGTSKLCKLSSRAMVTWRMWIWPNSLLYLLQTECSKGGKRELAAQLFLVLQSVWLAWPMSLLASTTSLMLLFGHVADVFTLKPSLLCVAWFALCWGILASFLELQKHVVRFHHRSKRHWSRGSEQKQMWLREIALFVFAVLFGDMQKCQPLAVSIHSSTGCLGFKEGHTTAAFVRGVLHTSTIIAVCLEDALALATSAISMVWFWCGSWVF